jgi:hypothetical protein
MARALAALRQAWAIGTLRARGGIEAEKYGREKRDHCEKREFFPAFHLRRRDDGFRRDFAFLLGACLGVRVALLRVARFVPEDLLARVFILPRCAAGWGRAAARAGALVASETSWRKRFLAKASSGMRSGCH